METFERKTPGSARDLSSAVPRLSIVIPAFQEALRLPGSLVRIIDHLGDAPQLRPAEIIVVDDGSRDDTAVVARQTPTCSGVAVAVLQHSTNRGKGAAVRTGLTASRGELVLLCDADLAAPIEEIGALVHSHSPRRVVIGSRALDRTLIETAQPWYRDLMGRIFNVVVRAVALPGVRDSQCGFKLFPGVAGRTLAACQRIDGFAFDVELLVLARHWGLEVVEVPVRWRHVEESRVRPIRHSGEMLRDVLSLSLRRLRGKLPLAPERLW